MEHRKQKPCDRQRLGKSMHPILTEREQKAFWEQLVGYVKNDKLVPIVGVEVLDVVVDASGGVENFYTLVARELVAQVDQVELTAPTRLGMAALNEVVCRYLRETRAGNARSEVLSAMRAVSSRNSLPPALLKLAELPLRLFVTTTADDLLARAIEQAQPQWKGKVRSVHYSPDLPGELLGPSSDGAPVVFHLFGHAESMGQYAVTDEDVLEFMVKLQSHGTSPELLLRLIRSKNLLFLGCGFPDWLARFFIRLGRLERFSTDTAKMDWLVDSTAEDTEFVAFLEYFSRSMKCFPLTPLQFVDRLGAHVSQAGLRMMRPASRPPPRDPERDILPGAVFLSYASEDRPIAERIHAALEANKIDCWFDRKQLKGGDDWEDKIRRNVQACRIFMPVISLHTTTYEPRFFRHEWDEAVRHRPGRRPDARFFLTVCIDAMSPEDPSVLPEFRKNQFLPLERDGDIGSDFIEAVTRAYMEAQLDSGGASDGA